MPPPYDTRAYRGYWLVQWNKGGPVDILAVDAEKLSGSASHEDAVAIVDGWHNAR